jgi:hypothetical protein
MNNKFELIENTNEDQIDSTDDLQRQFVPDFRAETDKPHQSELIDSAADRLRLINELGEDEWKNLSPSGREAVLREVGREIQGVYGHPAPPFMTENLDNRAARGYYGDGYTSDKITGGLAGSDYGIRLNSQGLEPGDGYMSDDPRVALETYLHEFRHSFQHEQALRVEQPQFRNLVADINEAESWHDNFENYNHPNANFETYHDQVVEMDARSFAEQILTKLYK